MMYFGEEEIQMTTIKLTPSQVTLLEQLLKYNIELLADNMRDSYVHPDDLIIGAQEIQDTAEVLKLLMNKSTRQKKGK